MPRPNWFLAFPLDGSFVTELPEPPKALRRFHPADVHMTLAFLGGCGETAAQSALAAFDERLGSGALRSLEVSLGPVVPLGRSKNGYTTLSALLDRGRDAATAWLTSERDALHDAANVPRTKRPAKPHVSLARVGGRASAESREAGLAWAASLELGAIRERLERVALYTWNDDRRERLFKIVAERRLG
jgi:2'-5' RNA ligase